MAKKKQKAFKMEPKYADPNIEIQGDEASANIIAGDKITVGNISDSTAAIGRKAQVIIGRATADDRIAEIFSSIYKQIEARPTHPDVEREEITATVKQIESEVVIGEKANPKKLGRWLKTLGMMAPDILDVTAATLANPAAGIARVIQKVAIKVNEDASKA